MESDPDCLLGCDFSSAPSRRKPIVLALRREQRGRVVLDGMETLDSLPAFGAWLAQPRAWVGGFDLPFGLPRELVFRHPFPGPGLGVRVLGEVTKARADVLREADAIFLEELRAADWYDRVSQAFAVYLPVKSVGVVGDGRRYADVIALRAVETVDFMTARAARLPPDLVEHVANRIINEIEGVSRVVMDVSSKPPATIEWE